MFIKTGPLTLTNYHTTTSIRRIVCDYRRRLMTENVWSTVINLVCSSGWTILIIVSRDDSRGLHLERGRRTLQKWFCEVGTVQFACIHIMVHRRDIIIGKTNAHVDPLFRTFYRLAWWMGNDMRTESCSESHRKCLGFTIFFVFSNRKSCMPLVRYTRTRKSAICWLGGTQL